MNFKKEIYPLVFLLVMVLFFSCGPSEEEKARQSSIQKHREDSIRIAVELETKWKIEQKRVLEDSIQQERTMVDAANNRLTYLQANLVAKKDRLEVIKQPQFLRTPAEREQEIRAQLIRISELENEIASLSNGIEGRLAQIQALEMALRRISKP